MKKVLKNKKGFTLVELLAVIVVLAVIMVIATQQVNKTIARSRANSLISSMDIAVKQAKAELAQGTLSNGDDLSDVVDYNTSEYTIAVSESEGIYTITLTAAANGKFEKVSFTDTETNTSATEKGYTPVDYSSSTLPSLTCTIDSDGNIQ